MLERRFGIDEESIELDVKTWTMRVNIHPLAHDYDEARLIQLGWEWIAKWKKLERLEVTVVVEDVETAYSLQ